MGAREIFRGAGPRGGVTDWGTTALAFAVRSTVALGSTMTSVRASPKTEGNKEETMDSPVG